MKDEVINILNNYENVPYQQPISLSDDRGNKTVLIGDIPSLSKKKTLDGLDRKTEILGGTLVPESTEFKINKLNKKLDDFYDLLKDRKISEDTYKMRVERILKELKNLENKKE